MHPMYLAYKPPTMLPTQTLHPSSTASNPATATNHSRLKKRDTTNTIAGAGKYFPSPTDSRWGNPDTWWSIGLAMTSFGSILYFYF